MIAIFKSQTYATRAANQIHNYLKVNRDGYDADKWAVSNKSVSEDKWAVKIPQDVPQGIIIGECEFVDKLPLNWNPIITL